MAQLEQVRIESKEQRRKLDNLYDSKRAYNYDINDTYGNSLKMPALQNQNSDVHVTSNNYFYGRLPQLAKNRQKRVTEGTY